MALGNVAKNFANAYALAGALVSEATVVRGGHIVEEAKPTVGGLTTGKITANDKPATDCNTNVPIAPENKLPDLAVRPCRGKRLDYRFVGP